MATHCKGCGGIYFEITLPIPNHDEEGMPDMIGDLIIYTEDDLEFVNGTVDEISDVGICEWCLQDCNIDCWMSGTVHCECDGIPFGCSTLEDSERIAAKRREPSRDTSRSTQQEMQGNP